MEIALRGSSPCATTAAILLMTRARQLGNLRLQVLLVGDPQQVARVPGPALVHAPVLASCGVGREHGHGGTVIVPGPPMDPLMVSVTPHGVSDWFLVDRTGQGCHPATQALVRLGRDPRVAARKLAKDLRRGLSALGMLPDTSVFDLLFAAPAPPLTRLALALRAGRALSGLRGEPVTRFLSGDADRAEPLPHHLDDALTAQLLDPAGLEPVLEGLTPAMRDRAEEWVEAARALAAEDGGRDLVLLHAVAELASHLVQLPPHSILPPLGAAEDALAIGLKPALAAQGDDDANQQLGRVFRFLGGRYVDHARHVHELPAVPEPEGALDRWRWFCSQAIEGRDQADALWPSIVDPPQ